MKLLFLILFAFPLYAQTITIDRVVKDSNLVYFTYDDKAYQNETTLRLVKFNESIGKIDEQANVLMNKGEDGFESMGYFPKGKWKLILFKDNNLICESSEFEIK